MRGSDWLDRLGIGALIGVALFSLALLLLPAVIVVIMSFDTRGYISFPPAGFTFDWYARLFNQPVLMGAMWTSIKVGVYVTVLCIALGVPTALACARGDFRGAAGLSVFVLLPHMVPGIVLGVAVLFAGALFGIGPSIWLQSISLAVYVMAVMVRTVMARLQKLDPLLEQAASNLGATRWQSFRTITLPLLMPAILAGAVFTFIEGFDNLSVTIFTHGYRDRPLPVELLTIVQNTNSPLVAAVSSVQILLAILALLAISATIGLDRVND
ncbi:ABC transporter permease [Bosea sp. SSUT16]|jgi:putative spermidine/putrescine transport system permease protein|uniref:ABC transporter permease n=1 Tax=Bosea spartocytisi TaxID=2773451 RepID=A0A927I026_9HYPH|nr:MULTISPECIES: ABC transporter permease [Bosea]MBD3848215.1 ABC transporter permease [Bosea spartocytisi]MCT4471792.1 ABC transporter permease [Bosea spartocytisi]